MSDQLLAKSGTHPTLLTGCAECHTWDWVLNRHVDAGGAECFPYCCAACGHKTNLAETKTFIALNRLSPPLHQTGMVRPKCERCGASGAQLHHWAPKYFFADANSWPKSYLCQTCHERWHDIVTPVLKGFRP